MATKLSLPSVKPIVPTRIQEPFDDTRYTFELKYDGFRGMFYLENERGRFQTKQQKEITPFRRLRIELLEVLEIDSAILDGEIVAFNEEGRPVFRDLIDHRIAPSYVAFDLLWLNGKDLRQLPLRERRKRLGELIPEDSDVLRSVVTVNERGNDFFRHVQEFDLEGLVAKRLADPYTDETAWMKILNPHYSQRRDERWKIFKEKK